MGIYEDLELQLEADRNRKAFEIQNRKALLASKARDNAFMPELSALANAASKILLKHGVATRQIPEVDNGKKGIFGVTIAKLQGDYSKQFNYRQVGEGWDICQKEQTDNPDSRSSFTVKEVAFLSPSSQFIIHTSASFASTRNPGGNVQIFDPNASVPSSSLIKLQDISSGLLWLIGSNNLTAEVLEALHRP